MHLLPQLQVGPSLKNGVFTDSGTLLYRCLMVGEESSRHCLLLAARALCLLLSRQKSTADGELISSASVPHHPRAVSAFQTHTAVLKALQHIWAMPCSLLAQSSSVCSATAFRKAENQSPYCTYWSLLHWGDLILQRNTTFVL